MDNVIELPINKINDTIPGEKQILKLCKKVNKILKENNVRAVAISKLLFESQLFKNQIYKENIHIMDGRWLFNYLFNDSVEYIISNMEAKIEDTEISVLANSIEEVLENNIIYLAQQCKLLNIITNNVEKFSQISEYLQGTYGILIRVSRNKKKGLLKSQIIINYDFPEELVNKCKFNTKAILVNLNEKLNISWKSFAGININYYSIIFKPELIESFNYFNLLECFSNEILYESTVFQKGNYDTIRKSIVNDKVRINNLIGVNGPIDKKEYIF